jgi:hypothetical protein
MVPHRAHPRRDVGPRGEARLRVERRGALKKRLRKEITMIKTRHTVVRQAADVLFRRLGRLSPSDGTERLYAALRDFTREDQEGGSALADREWDARMKRILALHVELSRIERHAPHRRVTASTTA